MTSQPSRAGHFWDGWRIGKNATHTIIGDDDRIVLNCGDAMRARQVLVAIQSHAALLAAAEAALTQLEPWTEDRDVAETVAALRSAITQARGEAKGATNA